MVAVANIGLIRRLYSHAVAVEKTPAQAVLPDDVEQIVSVDPNNFFKAISIAMVNADMDGSAKETIYPVPVSIQKAIDGCILRDKQKQEAVGAKPVVLLGWRSFRSLLEREQIKLPNGKVTGLLAGLVENETCSPVLSLEDPELDDSFEIRADDDCNISDILAGKEDVIHPEYGEAVRDPMLSLHFNF